MQDSHDRLAYDACDIELCHVLIAWHWTMPPADDGTTQTILVEHIFRRVRVPDERWIRDVLDEYIADAYAPLATADVEIDHWEILERGL